MPLPPINKKMYKNLFKNLQNKKNGLQLSLCTRKQYPWFRLFILFMKRKMTKKIAMFMMGVFALGGLGLSFASAGGSQVGGSTASTVQNLGKFWDSDSTSGLGVAGAGKSQENNLINIIKSAINWVLGMLSLITLCILLWGGFQMVTAAGDDTKFGAGQKILKQAGIGLGFIAASWMIVSLIFWVIGKVGAGA